MKVKTIFSAVSGILAASLLTASAQDKVEIIQKFVPGNTYTYQSKVSSAVTMHGPQGDMAMSNVMTQVYTNTAEKDEKGVKVTMAFKESAMEMTMNGAEMMNIDSKMPETLKGPEAAMIKEMLAMELSAIYDEKGRIIEVGEAKGGGAMADQVMDAATLKQMMIQASDLLPAEPLAVGGKWSAQTKMPVKQLGGEMVIDMNMTLDSVADDIATISFDGTMKMDAENDLISMTAKELSGTWLHDLKEGQIKSVSQKMVMEMTAPGAEQAIPMSADSEITLLSIVSE